MGNEVSRQSAYVSNNCTLSDIKTDPLNPVNIGTTYTIEFNWTDNSVTFAWDPGSMRVILAFACNGWWESICNFCFKMGIHMIDFTTFFKVLTENELYIIQCTFAIISVVYQVSNHSPPFALSHFRNITQQELCLAQWLYME